MDQDIRVSDRDWENGASLPLLLLLVISIRRNQRGRRGGR